MKERAVSNQLVPKARSKLRLRCGAAYYVLSRRLYWRFGGLRFAGTRSENLLPYLQFSHATPLYRKFGNADMELQKNKVVNLGPAVSKLNGIVVRPGETFSYWKLIGRPSRRRGYRERMVLYCGTVRRGVGGGLCQLSNLIYWMTLHTGLTVTERHRHSYDVFPDENRTQPFGSGATCVYNHRDLMIENRTGRPFQLFLRLTGTELQGAWFSTQRPYCTYEVYERSHAINREYWGGYTRNNVLYRKKTAPDGSVAEDEFLSENHALMMYEPYLKG